MSRQQILLLGIAVSLLVFFLGGCGGSPPAAVSEASQATSAPEQAAATPEPPTATSVPPTATPEPPTPTPEPPTATPTPAVVNPQPSAAFSGDLKSDETTSSGVINFKVSNDGNSISEGEIKLTGASLKPIECSGGSLEGMSELTQSLKGPFPVEDGKVNASLAEGGELKGAFTSPTEANGTIKVVVNITIFSNSIICDFGMWNWKAKAQ